MRINVTWKADLDLKGSVIKLDELFIDLIKGSMLHYV